MLIGGVSIVATKAHAQLKVGKNPTSIQKSAILELESDKQGLLLTRIADTSVMTSLAPPDGMIIYLTKTGEEGFYVRHSNTWERMATKASSWDLLGNALTSAATQFIGSTNNIPFVMKANNVEGIRIDNGDVTVKNKLTLSGIATDATASLLEAVIVDGTGKVYKRQLTKAAFADLTINGKTELTQLIKTDNEVDYKFTTTNNPGVDATHKLSIATQTGATGGPAVGLLTNADWNTFSKAAAKALQIAAFSTTGDAKGLTLGTDASNNPTIALNAATLTTPGGVSTGTQTFGGDKTFNGKITGENGLLITTGGADVTGNSKVTGTFEVTKTTKLGDMLTVASGGANITGAVEINGTSKLDNTVTLGSVATGTNEVSVLMLNSAKEIITRDLPLTAFKDITFSSDHAGTDLKVVKDATNNVNVSIPMADPSVAGGLVSNLSQSFAGNKRFGNDVAIKSTLNLGDTSAIANSTLQVQGSVSMAITEVTSSTSYSVTSNDYTIVVKNTSPVTVKLPSIAGTKGRIYTIKKAASDATNRLDNPVTIQAQAGQNIEDGNSINIYNDWTYITVQSNGTDTWYIIKK